MYFIISLLISVIFWLPLTDVTRHPAMIFLYVIFGSWGCAEIAEDMYKNYFNKFQTTDNAKGIYK